MRVNLVKDSKLFVFLILVWNQNLFWKNKLIGKALEMKQQLLLTSATTPGINIDSKESFENEVIKSQHVNTARKASVTLVPAPTG